MSPRKVRTAKVSSAVLGGATPVDDISKAHKFPQHQHQFTSRFLHSIWPPCFEPPTALVDMNMEETAIWVRMLAGIKGWKEYDSYAQIFKTHSVSGWMLTYLSVQSLKDDLKIDLFGHRLEIITAVNNNELTLLNPSIVCLCPDVFFMFAEEESHTSSDGYVLFNEKQHKDYDHKSEVKKWFGNGKNHLSLSTRNWNGVSASRARTGENSSTLMNDSLISTINLDDIILSKSVLLPEIASELVLFPTPRIESELSPADCAEIAMNLDFKGGLESSMAQHFQLERKRPDHRVF